MSSTVFSASADPSNASSVPFIRSRRNKIASADARLRSFLGSVEPPLANGHGTVHFPSDPIRAQADRSTDQGVPPAGT
jgi:hypothetical protein